MRCTIMLVRDVHMTSSARLFFTVPEEEGEKKNRKMLTLISQIQP